MDQNQFYLPHEKQIQDYLKTIEYLKKQNQGNPLFTAEIKKLEEKLDKLKARVYSALTPWERVLICRHNQRPQTSNYISKIVEDFVELSGDRYFGDDNSIIGGFGKIGGVKCVIVGQEKGNDTESRVKRNFGSVNPEGFRKALRLFKIAEKFSLPVVSLVDTKGADPRLEAEQRGQGWAIAQNLREMSSLKTPIIVVVIGEGCSGGALGIGIGDVIGMLEHAYYSVISPEGCASILWKDAGEKEKAASALKLNSENLLELGLVDEIIPEPIGGAHHDPQFVYEAVKQFIVDKWSQLKMIKPELLVENRYAKFRKMGQFTEV